MTRPILILPLLTGVLLLSACGHQAISPSLTLTESDRTAIPAVPIPDPIKLQPPKANGTDERNYLFVVAIKPLLEFSLSQEGAHAAELQRAKGIVAKVDAFNQATHPKPWWRFGG